MSQTKFSIAAIPGDGIGQEVTPEGRRVLDAVSKISDVHFEWTEFDWGTDYYFRQGQMMPSDAVAQLRTFDAILLGAIGHPDVPDNITLNCPSEEPSINLPVSVRQNSTRGLLHLLAVRPQAQSI